MKVYIAAPYGARTQAARYADQLTKLGVDVTAAWVYGSRPLSAATVHAAPGVATDIVSEFAQGDLADVTRADTLILLTESVCELEVGGAGSGGRHIETGYALGLGKRVIIVGEPENIFHRSSLVTRVRTWDEAISRVTHPNVRPIRGSWD